MRRIPVLSPLYRAARSAVDPDYRAIQKLKRDRAASVFQPWPTTQDDRYPVLFDEIARRLKALPEQRILSFGCASGEEVRAMRRRLPDAQITGVDINPRALEKAVRADRNPLSRYICAERPPTGEMFDAVIAMAVFRHGHLSTFRLPSCSDHLPFSRFEEGLAQIRAALPPGGLLALGNAQFRIADSRFAGDFRVELRLPDDPEPQRWLYGRDDRLLEGVSEDAVLFRKGASVAV